MNPFAYIRHLFRPQATNAHYDAARFSRDRSWIPGLTQSALKDINSGDRIELLRRARYFEKNNPLMQRVLDLIEANVVGTGINPTPSSSSSEYNDRALKAWNEWCKFSDLTSRQNFYTLQGIIARAQCLDGEIFIWLTDGNSGRPRIQLIESHRIRGCALPADYKRYIDCDGVLLDERGRPAFYCVQNEVSVGSVAAGSVTIIPADQIVHFFEPSRAGQYRGITLFHAGIVTLHDLDDLQRYEMLAAKDSAERANIVYTESGEMPKGSVIGRSLTQTKDDGTQVTSDVYYEQKFGGRTVVMKRGDKWEQGSALRPSPAMREFWEYLTKQFCRSIGISYAAIEDYNGWGGAALRGAITCDNRFYEIRTRALTSGMQRIYEYVIGWSNESGELGTVPADWFNVQWQPPRRATVDIGRESTAVINELRAGTRTYRDVLGELGLDWRDVLRQRAEEEAFIDKLALENKIDRTRIAALGPNERAAVTQPDPSQPAGVQAVHAHNPEQVIAFMQAPALDVPCEAETPLPSSFVWMPAGTHAISAGTPNGETWKGRVLCDEKGAQNVIRDFNASLAQGRKLWIDFNHEDAAAAAWVKSFSWDARGIICSVEWTSDGEEALRGKVYYSFSPAFLVDRDTGRVAGLVIGHAAGGLVNAPAFGAAMPALIAARLGSDNSTHTASGKTPENPQPTMKDIMLKLLASLKVQVPADATEEQLTALVAKHSAEAQATQNAEVEKLKADLVTAKAAAEKSAEAITAKEKELAEVKASAAKSPGVVVLAPGVDSGSRISAQPNAFESIKAFQKETDPRKRGLIYCGNIREFVAKTRNVAEVLAANSFGSVTSDLIVLRSLDLLKLTFPVLGQITTDFSDRVAKQGQSIKTRIISVPSVVTYNDSTGWASSDATATDVPVVIGQPVGVQIALVSTEVAGSNRDLFAEQVEAAQYALGKNMVDALYAVITQANFTGAPKRTIKALASFARADVVDMGTALSKRGVPVMGRTLLLNSDYFGALNKDSTLVSLAALLGAGSDVITARKLPNIADFSVIEASNLPANAFTSTTGTLQGFGFTKDALVMATRLPEDYTRALPGASHGSVSVVTNPDTGISVQKVDFVDHVLGKAYSRIAMSYGVAKGQINSGQCLTET